MAGSFFPDRCQHPAFPINPHSYSRHFSHAFAVDPQFGGGAYPSPYWFSTSAHESFRSPFAFATRTFPKSGIKDNQRRVKKSATMPANSSLAIPKNESTVPKSASNKTKENGDTSG